MVSDHLDPNLVERLKLVENQDYEGTPLQSFDYLTLTFAGLFVPFGLMIWGWMV